MCAEVDGKKGRCVYGCRKEVEYGTGVVYKGRGSGEVGLVKGDGGLFIGKGTTEQKIRFPILKLELLGFSFRSITVTKSLRLARCTLALPHIPHAPATAATTAPHPSPIQPTTRPGEAAGKHGDARKVSREHKLHT